MKFELVILDNLSGDKTTILSPILEGQKLTLYELFVEANRNRYRAELVDIDERLENIGKVTGLMDEFFKTGSGKFGQNICTFKDHPRSLLRLYFIEFGNAAIILGGGGHKPKSVRTSQEVPQLAAELEILGLIAETLKKAEEKGHFGIDEDGNLFSTTNYTYNTDDYVKPSKKK